jgi:hypothetical protein
MIERVPKTHRYRVTDFGFRAALVLHPDTRSAVSASKSWSSPSDSSSEGTLSPKYLSNCFPDAMRKPTTQALCCVVSEKFSFGQRFFLHLQLHLEALLYYLRITLAQEPSHHSSARPPAPR